MAISDIASLKGSAETTPKKKSTELGQAEFMKLMTTQLKNQDPFEPMDNGEFLSQIAQFGTVNGINELKNSFSGFASSMKSNQALQATSLIGHGVLANTSLGYLSANGVVEGGVELENFASNVAVNIYDFSGQLINRIDMGEQSRGTVVFGWDGKNFSGNHAPAGDYRFEVEVIEGGQTSIYPTMLYGNVNSLELGKVGEEMQVDVQGLGQIPFSQINKIL